MTTRTLVEWTTALIVAIAITPLPAAAIQLEPVLTGLSSPLFVTNAGDGSDRLFVLERAGVIKVLQPGETTPTVFLDITTRVLSAMISGSPSRRTRTEPAMASSPSRSPRTSTTRALGWAR